MKFYLIYHHCSPTAWLGRQSRSLRRLMAASSQRLVRTNQPSGQDDVGDDGESGDGEDDVGDEDQV